MRLDDQEMLDFLRAWEPGGSFGGLMRTLGWPLWKVHHYMSATQIRVEAACLYMSGLSVPDVAVALETRPSHVGSLLRELARGRGLTNIRQLRNSDYGSASVATCVS